MFEKPDGQDAVWKSQKSVHGLALIILLVERRYPLSKFTLEQLVNVTRLQVEEESEMSLELLRSRVSEGVSTQIEAISASDVDFMWNTLASIIKDGVKDSLGVAIGTSNIHTNRKESWWLCEEVQSKVAKKQARLGQPPELEKVTIPFVEALVAHGLNVVALHGALEAKATPVEESTGVTSTNVVPRSVILGQVC
nr:cleavage/polyadenylation specificity factor, 25kDa subunit [Tanacetum cinerariifolium]